ncbi:MAG: O-antigen ligase family protein [Candidatus Izimaplasma sp.]|nr:O-antigen ligase family protein [Candidatus Izimaplasma bacterium]
MIYDNIIHAMKNDKLYNKTIYFVLISSFAFMFWYNGLDFLGMTLFVIASFFVLFFVRNSVHVLPFLFNMLFLISRTEWSLDTIPNYLYILPIVLLLGFVIHYFKFKENVKKGQLTYPIFLMVLAMFLSILNSDIININYGFYLIIGIFYVTIYLFFIQTIKGKNLIYILRLFVVLGVLISTQVFIYYLNIGDIINALETKEIDLGWGISNFIATYLIIFISSTVYFLRHSKFKIIFSIIISFEIFMLLFTLSRAGILAFVVILPFLVSYLFHDYQNKKQMFLYTIIIIILLILVIGTKTDYFIPIWNRFVRLPDQHLARIDLWKEAFVKFKEHPILGAGLFARVEDNYFGFYHNTFMHTLATLGIVGFISLMWQIVIVFKVFLKEHTPEKIILLIALIGANVHGLVDNVYYMPQFMILFFVIIAVVEIHNRNSLPVIKIWRITNEN